MSVPKVEKDDWNCKGQLITLTMPLKSSFGEVKAKIEADTGMPPGKQKLQCESIFVKGKYKKLFGESTFSTDRLFRRIDVFGESFFSMNRPFRSRMMMTPIDQFISTNRPS